MTTNKASGSILIVIAVFGFLTVADDLRHVGELLGVACVLLSGILLLAGGFFSTTISLTTSRALSLGLLLGIPVGAGLDNMVVGPLIGLGASSIVSILAARKKRQNAGSAA